MPRSLSSRLYALYMDAVETVSGLQKMRNTISTQAVPLVKQDRHVHQ